MRIKDKGERIKEERQTKGQNPRSLSLFIIPISFPLYPSDMDNEKKHLRSLLLQQRRGFSSLEVNEKSQRILAHLCSFQPFLAARTVVLYGAESDEVQTEAIWHEAVRLGQAVYYPRITTDRADLEFVRRAPGVSLVPGTFHIPIPPGNDLISGLQSTDVVLTPGVGFDKEGHRLGRGRGYYDRAFRGVLAGALRVALAFAFQIVPGIPTAAADERIHYVVTENGIHSCCEGTDDGTAS